MSKIGILTFHRAHNYGAVLQAFASQECLKELGHDVYFIDYENKKLMDIYKTFNFRRIISRNPILFFKRLKKEIETYPVKRKRSKAFDEFIERNLLISSHIDEEYINSYYDYVYIGSDQVWNFHLTRGFDKYYWGQIKHSNSNLRIISYAASMEVLTLSEADKKEISQNLKNIDSISVREDSLKENLESLTNRNISVVADPTLLLGREFWSKFATKPKVDKPYLLLYQVRSNSKNELMAKNIAKKLGLEVVFLSARIDAQNSTICKAASPSDYLGLFKNASFILCSSFHGTVFSAVFQVPFYSILMNDGKDSRSLSLLNFLNLKHRAISDENQFVEEPIDWKQVEGRLDEIKKSSLNFINSVIQ